MCPTGDWVMEPFIAIRLGGLMVRKGTGVRNLACIPCCASDVVLQLLLERAVDAPSSFRKGGVEVEEP